MKKQKINAKSIIKKLEKRKMDILKYDVKKIGIFGSYVKNKQKNRSDVDVIVEFDKISFENYIGLSRLLEKILGKKIDLVIESDLKPELEYVKEEAEYAKI